mmetsp:Transcript_17344/g.29909  ORF Transcript_17344/g.29909 Transcript_17344/m.29909 type:complete len:208 (-) Transcript_17344:417-1040(-)
MLICSCSSSSFPRWIGHFNLRHFNLSCITMLLISIRNLLWKFRITAKNIHRRNGPQSARNNIHTRSIIQSAFILSIVPLAHTRRKPSKCQRQEYNCTGKLVPHPPPHILLKNITRRKPHEQRCSSPKHQAYKGSEFCKIPCGIDVDYVGIVFFAWDEGVHHPVPRPSIIHGFAIIVESCFNEWCVRIVCNIRHDWSGNPGIITAIFG